MPYTLWTRAVVSQLTEQRFGVRLPVRTMGLYLACWSPAAAKKWLEEE